MKIILLTIIVFSMLNATYTKSGDIVTDSASGLEWQDNARVLQMTWENAIVECEDLVLDGYSDWRLPSVNELKTIVDRSKANPAIVETFENSSWNMYWSSTTVESGYRSAWVIRFDIGDIMTQPKDNHRLITRCVRDGE